MAAAGPVYAQVVQFDLPAQPAASAIQAFGRQAAVQIFARSEALANVTTNPVRGRYEARQALALMLAGTRLSVTSDDGKVLVVDRAGSDRPSLLLPIVNQTVAGPAASASAPAPAPAPAATTSPASAIEEVVVTATRQTDTVNRVALSIAAVTQKNLDQQGIKTASDLTRIVPSLTLVNQTAGVGTFAIRGIVATTGAATTGVYLDDTSLTKRNNAGVSQNNGAPLPTLFDLERVEVLKGPQGTLYGGSSEGGTVRFITPTPSLTTYSGLARAELSTVENGALSNELGLAVGGPILMDKVGFRLSALTRFTGGYVDVMSPYSGQLVKKDANSSSEQALRGTLRWDVTDKARVTLAGYRSVFISNGGPGSTTVVYAPNGQPAPTGYTYSTPAVCYNIAARLNPPYSAAGPTALGSCPGTAAPGQTVGGVYMRPAASYGPWTLGKDQSLAPYDGVIRGGKTTTNVASATVDYDFGVIQAKSITSYIEDSTSGDGGESNDPGRVQTTTQNPGKTSFPLFSSYPVYSGRFISLNRRHGIEEELRFSSRPTDRPLTWVAGLFVSNLNTHINYTIYGNYDGVDQALYGLSSLQRYSIGNPNGYVSVLDAGLIDTELAGFGEANYWVTSKLKLTAGVRVSRVGLKFTQANYGQLSARADVNAPFAYVAGETTDTPVTPKFGLQYQISDNDMLYFNAAKGFRAGGVNVPLNPQVCTAGLALFGLTVNDIPKQYGPDEVWSYEVGGKFRLLDNKMQLNLAGYQIDWTQIQVTTSAQGCGQNWNQNGGTAQSRGFDLQTEYRPIRPLQLTASVGYTNAVYTQPVLGPKPTTAGVTQAVTFNKGDPIGVPTWQTSLGARYDFNVAEIPGYLRADYQYTGAYVQGPSFGTGNYNPFQRNVPSNDQLNLRAGITYQNWEVSVFSNNILNARAELSNGNGVGGIGQTGCSVSGGTTCTVYSLFNPFVASIYQRPRSVGIQANFRF
ncbi:MAG: TonB-dependent receptor domain-containing protein [Caulobacteraceae bacterium]